MAKYYFCPKEMNTIVTIVFTNGEFLHHFGQEILKIELSDKYSCFAAMCKRPKPDINRVIVRILPYTEPTQKSINCCTI